MDWFSWLSKTALEPSLVYEYGLALARNELQLEDVSYFNHEFLQSMGISVAKHRLEILKLARKENRGGPGNLTGLIVAINKTRKCFNKYIAKWVFRDDIAFKAAPPHPLHLRGALLRRYRSEESNEERVPVPKKRSITLSGPLDGRVREKVMVNTRSLKLSGPLDGKLHEKAIYTARSPRFSGPLYAAKSPKLVGPIDGWPPERLMVTTKSPRLQERLMVTSRSPGTAGSLDGKVAAPVVYSHYNNQEKEDVDHYDDHSLWATLFHDMKPT
ncbi:uncharacterized protein LOC133857547 [Alnus glutinosa]|uniref:uncharacterized protein LOC133857547 n=1 Tax=Alnus glutinosa TaxID=3517 RepID=UPI002D76C420|nr:uncharacterized protein LOC133857547 [Alnus glutinosa]